MASAVAEFIMKCFHARTTAHVLHLKTRSFAAHKALQDFYDDIVPLVDSLAEAYQGEYGIIESYPSKFQLSDDGLALLEDLAKWIEENREDVCDSSHCQNIIDEIAALVYSTRYKLKFLK